MTVAPAPPTTFEPLGDQAVLARCPDETGAARLVALARAAPPAWLVDVVQAYRTVALFYPAGALTYAEARGWAEGLLSREVAVPAPGRLHEIPVCYEMGPDLVRVAEHTELSAEEVVRLHTSAEYTVYAIGFCPGFPYLGYLPEPLCGVPRLPSPRVRVEAGSVGLTGRQTGIYPLVRPGGWNLVGRTPLVLVDVAHGFFPIRTGDRVRFTRIDAGRFRQLEGQRIAST